MFGDIVSGFARDYTQNGSLLPKAARSISSIVFVVGALAFPEPIVDGVVSASNELTARVMENMQPVIDSIASTALPTNTD